MVQLVADFCANGSPDEPEPTEIWGIDASPGMVRMARGRFRSPHPAVRVRFDVGYAERLPFADGWFDVVLCSFVYHHLPRRLKRRATGEAFRILKPGGRYAVCDYDKPRSRLGRIMWWPLRLSDEYLGEHWRGEIPEFIAAGGFHVREQVTHISPRTGVFVAEKPA
jgi:ubiquinone/menaquinone biosynthesis C-methylase UbiE